MYEICEARTMRICPAIGDETLCEVLWVSYLEFIPKSSMKLKDILDQMGRFASEVFCVTLPPDVMLSLAKYTIKH